MFGMVPPNRGASGFDHRCVGRNLDLFGFRADLELNVDAEILIDLQRDASAFGRFKSLRFRA